VYRPTCIFFGCKFGLCPYVSFLYFFPFHVIYYCSFLIHNTVTLSVCVCAFVTLNKRLTYLHICLRRRQFYLTYSVRNTTRTNETQESVTEQRNVSESQRYRLTENDVRGLLLYPSTRRELPTSNKSH